MRSRKACLHFILTVFLCLAVLPAHHAQSNFPRFTDVAARAGLTSPSIYGAADSKKYIIETNGCGVAFYDYDRDGWMDLLVLSGTRLPEDSKGFPKNEEPTNRLYRNNRD